jgi:hypothetical protein
MAGFRLSVFDDYFSSVCRYWFQWQKTQRRAEASRRVPYLPCFVF